MPPSQRRRPSRSRSPGPPVRPHQDYVPSSWRDYVPLSWRDYLPLSFRDSYPPSSATANTAQPSGSQHPCQVSTVSRHVSRPGGCNSNLAQAPTATTTSVGHFSVHPPSHPNHSDSTHRLRLFSPENTGMFYQPRDCTVTGTFVDASNVTYNASSNAFMKELLKETIRGAAHDSSARDPPPRCQPGTRLAILERCVSFISNCDGVQKMRWVVGTAGVGKSAIMQSVAESPNLPGGPPASVFFSINGRDDGTKTITTLCYQLAAKFGPYRQVIEHSIILDPSLLLSSMEKQFKKLIVEPLVQNAQPDRADRVVIIIDGLDECKNPRTQLELLRLISDLCLKHPSSPLVWLIASRPEPHITSFFSDPNIIPVYEKEEAPIDSDESRADVERFLRAELMRIKHEFDSLDARWPSEQDFWKIANAAGGLFAYAQTVINYVGDSRIGGPASQLSDVLCVIDKIAVSGLSGGEHPMAFLDALYERVLSNVPDRIMTNTRKFLMVLASSRDSHKYFERIDINFVILCNWLGITADEAYAALHHLRSVLYVPRRDKAHKENLRTFHKSFTDYISDFNRSGLFSDFLGELSPIKAECSFRLLKNLADGLLPHSFRVHFRYGVLASGPTTLDTIPLTWHITDSDGHQAEFTRLKACRLAIEDLIQGIECGDRNFWKTSFIHFMASTWSSYEHDFPHYGLLNAAFDETRRSEFMIDGILQRIPLTVVAGSAFYVFPGVKLQFRGPVSRIEHPQGPSCQHMWEEDDTAASWKTTFSRCGFCRGRLAEQLKTWKTDLPDDTALVMFTSTGRCCAQVRLVDPERHVSQWTYTFWCFIQEHVRKKYGSAV